MEELKFEVEHIDGLNAVSIQMAKLIDEYKIITFVGDLGAGKTALAKSFLHDMGVKDSVTSPTFSIINEYVVNGDVIYHMDLYRIKSVEELLEIGIEEYLFGGSLCLIEWPSLIYELLEEPWIEVEINNEEGVRGIVIKERSQ